jgi:hypothetical protein
MAPECLKVLIKKMLGQDSRIPSVEFRFVVGELFQDPIRLNHQPIGSV